MNIFFDVLRYGLYRIRIIYEVEGTREKKKVNKGGSEGGRKERKKARNVRFIRDVFNCS